MLWNMECRKLKQQGLLALISAWHKKNVTGSVINKKRTGRLPGVTIRLINIMKRKVQANLRLTAVGIQKDLSENYSVSVSVSTVKSILMKCNLHGRRPSRKPMISAKNRKACLAFAKKYANWDFEDWARVLWSDESKFNIFSSDGIQYIRRRKNERYNVKYQVPTVKYGGGSIMVWGCLSVSAVGPLIEVQGTMYRFQYGEILKNTMLPYPRAHLCE